MPRKRKLAVCLGVAALLGGASVAHGVVVGFEAITLNDPQDAAAGQAQLSMDVAMSPEGLAAFTFYNIGSYPSTLAQVYFERGPLADLVSIATPDGVEFQEGGSPKDLPGGSEAGPPFVTAYRATADSPVPRNGVNNGPLPAGEWVSVLFAMDPGTSYQDLLQQIRSGQLRVGVHVQDFASGGSESFISDGGSIPPVPEPATASLSVAGLLAAGVIRLRRQRSMAAGQ